MSSKHFGAIEKAIKFIERLKKDEKMLGDPDAKPPIPPNPDLAWAHGKIDGSMTQLVMNLTAGVSFVKGAFSGCG